MRLTKKQRFTPFGNYELNFELDNGKLSPTGTQQDVINKLGQLEDIEEELGIDLITLFKALKNGAWFKRTTYDICKLDWFMDFSIELRSKDNNHNNLMNTIEFDLDYDCEFEYKLSDYGKTWALTREELENE